MNHFTPKEAEPSEKTLHLIRQIARLYTQAYAKGDKYNICIN